MLHEDAAGRRVPGRAGADFKLHQRLRPRGAHDQRPGDLVVPGLAVFVEDDPQEAEAGDDHRQEAAESAHDRRVPVDLRAVAAYAPFADLRALAYELYGWLWYLKYPFVGLLRGWSWLFFGHDITAVSPERAAASLTVPVLLLASRQDEQISFAHAERLQRALARNSHSEFVFTDRGRHGELPQDVAASLTRFFLLYLKEAR